MRYFVSEVYPFRRLSPAISDAKATNKPVIITTQIYHSTILSILR